MVRSRKILGQKIVTRRFHATGIPMAKDLRLHFSAQCVLREITILQNFVIEKVEKNISLQRFRDLKALFPPSPQIFRLLLNPIVLKI
jgi:hypothetical protein